MDAPSITPERRKEFIARVRSMLPAFNSDLRRLEDAEYGGQRLLQFQRPGMHIFGTENKPIDYLPSMHSIFICTVTGTLPAAVWEAFGSSSEAYAHLYRSKKIQCPHCAQTIFVSIVQPLGPEDLVLVTCPRVLETHITKEESTLLRVNQNEDKIVFEYKVSEWL